MLNIFPAPPIYVPLFAHKHSSGNVMIVCAAKKTYALPKNEEKGQGGGDEGIEKVLILLLFG
jgi:hypothetical protein